MAFWRMLKQGYDHFEVTRQEPKVDVCEKRYVFNAESPTGGALSFSSRNRCPAYQVNPEVAAAVGEKTEKDERQFADYVARGTPTVAIRTGADGGMHPTFLARLKPKNLLDGIFNDTKIAGAQPGSLPAHVNPPREITTASTGPNDAAPIRAAAYVTPVTASQMRSAAVAATQTRSAPPRSEPAVQRSVASNAPPPLRGATTPAPAAKSEPRSDQRVAEAQAPQPQAPAPSAGIISGAVAAPVPAATFDSRFGAAFR
jgi:hypothetical protein